MGLQSLNIGRCRKITDESIILISTYCTGLQSLNLENCVNINDASLKAIAMNCTRLRSLCTDGCDKLSSDVLRCSKFKSASELRIVLLSISNVPA